MRMIHKIRTIAELIDAANHPSIGDLFHGRVGNLPQKCIGKSPSINHQKGVVEEIGDLCIQLLRNIQCIVFHRYDFIGGCKVLLTLRPGG